MIIWGVIFSTLHTARNQHQKLSRRRGGGVYSLIWPIRGCAVGQGTVFDLSIPNREYNFARVYPKKGIQFRVRLSIL